MTLRTLIAVAVIAAVAYAGISIYTYLFKSRKTIDTRLADMAMKEILFQESIFDGRITDFKATGEGNFRIDLAGIGSAEEAGRVGYNAVVVLDGANIKLGSPRNVFRIEGYLNDELIFDIYYATNSEPVITMRGQFAGHDYELPYTTGINIQPEPATPNRQGPSIETLV